MPKRATEHGRSDQAKTEDAMLRSALMHHFMLNLALSGDCNRELSLLSFGRPHHRITSIAMYMPGISIGELIKVLRASHQSLYKPIRELIAAGYISQKRDLNDQRIKRLYATKKGQTLINKTWAVQSKRFREAFKGASKSAIVSFFELHRRMLEQGDMEVIGRIQGASASHLKDIKNSQAH